MSFLDNLENNLKALESREDKDPETLRRAQLEREAMKEEARRTAPHTDALKNGPFAGDLLAACRSVAHPRRLLVRPAWVDSIFRLEAGARKLELRPTPDGVQAVFIEDGLEKRSELADLEGDAGALARRWLGDE